jgi:hypothetical protein
MNSQTPTTLPLCIMTERHPPDPQVRNPKSLETDFCFRDDSEDESPHPGTPERLHYEFRSIIMLLTLVTAINSGHPTLVEQFNAILRQEGSINEKLKTVVSKTPSPDI